jgi:hemolysin III
LISTYTPLEERLHVAIHGAGLVAGVIAVPWLVSVAVAGRDGWRVLGAVVFGICALLVLATSTVYHSSGNPVARQRWRQLDHAAIFLLIAGTYTPFAIGVMRGVWGWGLFGALWGIALLGILANTLMGFRYPRMSTALYLAMGWAGIVAIKPLLAALSGETLGWILAGGLFYTAGVPFYVWKSRRFTHAIWHLMVLAGVACHFMAVHSTLRAPG